jgi:hypothetical protein
MGRVKHDIMETMEKAETIEQAIELLHARGYHGMDLDDTMTWEMWYNMLDEPELEQAILQELRRVELNLSPENLNHDGERDPADANAAFTRLSQRRAELVEKLGREPRHSELFPEPY